MDIARRPQFRLLTCPEKPPEHDTCSHPHVPIESRPRDAQCPANVINFSSLVGSEFTRAVVGWDLGRLQKRTGVSCSVRSPSRMYLFGSLCGNWRSDEKSPGGGPGLYRLTPGSRLFATGIQVVRATQISNIQTETLFVSGVHNPDQGLEISTGRLWAVETFTPSRASTRLTIALHITASSQTAAQPIAFPPHPHTVPTSPTWDLPLRCFPVVTVLHDRCRFAH